MLRVTEEVEELPIVTEKEVITHNREEKIVKVVKYVNEDGTVRDD